MDDRIEPLNLDPIYCISGIETKRKVISEMKPDPGNTNSLIITILNKYAGDFLINLSDNKFIAMENEITKVLTKYRNEIEMELKMKT